VFHSASVLSQGNRSRRKDVRQTFAGGVNEKVAGVGVTGLEKARSGTSPRGSSGPRGRG